MPIINEEKYSERSMRMLQRKEEEKDELRHDHHMTKQ